LFFCGEGVLFSRTKENVIGTVGYVSCMTGTLLYRRVTQTRLRLGQCV
jgi:hypothetical protein